MIITAALIKGKKEKDRGKKNREKMFSSQASPNILSEHSSRILFQSTFSMMLRAFSISFIEAA
jgi:hypothetical protein